MNQFRKEKKYAQKNWKKYSFHFLLIARYLLYINSNNTDLIPKFYEKLLKNPNIGQFFSGIDATKQKTMLKAFFTNVLGGPSM